MADNQVYEGQWKANQRHGRGKLSFSNSHVFEGFFQDDVIHGTGTYHCNGEQPAIYIGEWVNNQLLKILN